MPNNGHPVIEAITEQAKLAIGSSGLIIDTSPFRLGRESRDDGSKGWFSNRRVFRSKPNNEYYMRDHGYLKQVSREHFLIKRIDESRYLLHDRGSRCGTRVNDMIYGLLGQSNDCALRNGDIIVVGSSESPYVFKFVEPQSAE